MNEKEREKKNQVRLATNVELGSLAFTCPHTLIQVHNGHVFPIAFHIENYSEKWCWGKKKKENGIN